MKLLGFVLVAAVTAIAGIIVGFYVTVYLKHRPAEVAAVRTAPGHVHLTLQTVAAIGHGTTPDWVSYFARDSLGRWRHSTILKVPAHSLVTVTLYEYDGQSGLRNPLLGQSRGLVGGTMRLNGKTMPGIDPDTLAHSFTIPGLGVSVPLEGVADNAKHQCGAAPCALDTAHNTIVFTFRTGASGKFRWQCFVPCAAGFIYGFGGPMQTLGYMDGELEVV